MPVGRYLIFVGSLLFALLLFADWYFPRAAAVASRSEVDRTILRINSDHRWPERIVIDTSLPTLVPLTVLTEKPPGSRDSREAFARIISSPPPSLVNSPLSSGIAAKTVRQRKPKLATHVPPPSIASFQSAYTRDTVAGGW
jgi:hypothetical protein